MTENHLTSRLANVWREQLKSFTVFKHADRFTHGVPDFSVSGHGIVSWWEVKYADPGFESPGIQELTMIRLHAATKGRAHYIIFAEPQPPRFEHEQTLILTPQDLVTWPDCRLPELQAWRATTGFDFYWLTDFVRSVHDSVRL
jgi:hypothetical protein